MTQALAKKYHTLFLVFFLSVRIYGSCGSLIGNLADDLEAPLQITINNNTYIVDEPINSGSGAHVFVSQDNSVVIKVRKDEARFDRRLRFDVEEESLNRLHELGIPVPKVIHRVDEEVLVKEYIPGETLGDTYFLEDDTKQLVYLTRKLYELAKLKMKHKIFADDLHAENLVFHENEKKWYIIDPAHLTRNYFTFRRLTIEGQLQDDHNALLIFFFNLLKIKDKDLENALIENADVFFDNFFRPLHIPHSIRFDDRNIEMRRKYNKKYTKIKSYTKRKKDNKKEFRKFFKKVLKDNNIDNPHIKSNLKTVLELLRSAIKFEIIDISRL